MTRSLFILILSIVFSCYPLIAQDIAILTENSKNRRLYAGIDNPLFVKVEPNSYDSIALESNNGKIVFDHDRFIAIPNRSGRARIKIMAYSPSDTTLLHTANFLVNSVPQAELQLGDTLLNQTKVIMKDDLIAKGSFNIYFNDDIINCKHWFTIHDITFGYTIGGFFHRHINEGPEFTEETIEMLKKIHPGSELTIKARIRGDGNVLKTLPLYTSRLY